MSNKWNYAEGDSISVELVGQGQAESVKDGSKIRLLHLDEKGLIKYIVEFYAKDMDYAFRKYGIKKRLIKKGKEHLKLAEKMAFEQRVAECTEDDIKSMKANALNNHAKRFNPNSNVVVYPQATIDKPENAERFKRLGWQVAAVESLHDSIVKEAMDWYKENTDWTAFKPYHWEAAYRTLK